MASLVWIMAFLLVAMRVSKEPVLSLLRGWPGAIRFGMQGPAGTQAWGRSSRKLGGKQ